MRSARVVLALAAVAVLAAGCTEGMGRLAAKAPTVVARVNCGDAKAYTDETGATWAADQVYGEGKTWGAVGGQTITREDLKIEGTKMPEVFLTERYSMTAYRFDLPNGTYAVKLYFAETYSGITADGERVFSVSLQGKPVLTDFDVFKATGGFAKPVVQTFKNAEVTDGKLMIEFTPKVQNPEINGLEILKE